MEKVNRVIEISGETDDFVQAMREMERSGLEVMESLGRKAEELNEKLEKMGETAQGGGGSGRGRGSRRGGGGGFFGGAGRFGTGLAQGVGAGLGLSAFTSISGALGAIMSEGRKMDEETRQTMAAIGATPESRSGENIGIADPELMEYIRMIATQRGIGGEEGIEGSRRQLETERAFGRDLGSLTGLQRYIRAGGDEVDETVLKLAQKAFDSHIWDIDVDGEGKIKGFTGLEEAVEGVKRLNERQLEISEDIDTGRSVDVFSRFAELGGLFQDDPRTTQAIESINQGLTNPANEFIQAQISSVLADMGAGSLFDMRMMQREGVFEPEMLTGLVSRLSESVGTEGDSLNAALSVAFPNLNRETIGRLTRLADPEFQQQFLAADETTREEMLGTTLDDLSGKAEEGTGQVLQIQASVANLTGSLGKETINAIGGKAEDMLDTVHKMIIDPSGTFDEAVGKFDKTVDGLQDFISNKLSGGGEVTEEEQRRIDEKMRRYERFNEKINPVKWYNPLYIPAKMGQKVMEYGYETGLKTYYKIRDYGTKEQKTNEIPE